MNLNPHVEAARASGAHSFWNSSESLLPPDSHPLPSRRGWTLWLAPHKQNTADSWAATSKVRMHKAMRSRMLPHLSDFPWACSDGPAVISQPHPQKGPRGQELRSSVQQPPRQFCQQEAWKIRLQPLWDSGSDDPAEWHPDTPTCRNCEVINTVLWVPELGVISFTAGGN